MGPSFSRPLLQRSFIVERTGNSCKRTVITDTTSLVFQLMETTSDESGRLLVLPGQLDNEMSQTLTLYGGVERKFLRAYMDGKAYRSKRHSWQDGEKSWCWKFPMLTSSVQRNKEACIDYDGKVELLSAYLWVGSNIAILLVEPSFLLIMGMTCQPAFEDELWNELASGGFSLSVEDHVSRLIYDRWIDYMAGLKITEVISSVLWELTVAVEQNIEQTKYLGYRYEELPTVDEDAWDSIMSMIKRRQTLKMLEQQEK